MYCSRVFRLFNVSSLCKLIPKNNCRLYNNPCYFFRLYNQQVKYDSWYLKTCKHFMSLYAFRTKTNCRHNVGLYAGKQSAGHGSYTKLISFSGLLSFIFGKEEDKESELIMTIKRGVLCIQREEFKTAEQILHVALRLAQEQHNADGITYVYDLLANVAFELGEWEKAEKLFLNVMQREMAKGTLKDDMKIIHISLKMAKIYESLDDHEKAEIGFQYCLQQLQSREDKSADDEDVFTLWAMTLDWYARFLQEKSRMEEALIYYKKAYEMCRRVKGEIHEQNVILLNDIGTIMYLKGDKEGALECMNKAIEIGKHLPNMEDFASVYINLGNIYLQKGMYAEAKKSCTEGFQNATRHSNPEGIKEANICLEEVKKMYNK